MHISSEYTTPENYSLRHFPVSGTGDVISSFFKPRGIQLNIRNARGISKYQLKLCCPWGKCNWAKILIFYIIILMRNIFLLFQMRTNILISCINFLTYLDNSTLEKSNIHLLIQCTVNSKYQTHCQYKNRFYHVHICMVRNAKHISFLNYKS